MIQIWDNSHKLITAFLVRLFQKYPNLFNPSTLSTYWLKATGYAELARSNILGQKLSYDEKYLRNVVKEAGGGWNKDKKVWEL